jgi:uncharacterized protein with von Willebrand factor type A (vWA) domain
LEKMAEKHPCAEEKAEIDALGGFTIKLMETLKKRLKKKGRHQGGSVGTAGTSPLVPAVQPRRRAHRQDASRHQRAVVWDKREFQS